MKYLALVISLFAAVLPLLRSAAVADAIQGSPRSDQKIQFSGSLVMPDGKPAANAIITVDVVDKSAGQVISTHQIKPNAKGVYAGDVSLDWSKDQSPIVFAAMKSYFAPISINYAGHQTVIQQLTNVRVHLVRDDDGSPISNVRISPAYLMPLDGNALIPAAWNDIVDSRWTVTTDAFGDATIKDLPQSYSVILHIDDARYIEPDLNSVGLQLALSPHSPDQTIRIEAGGSVSGSVIYAQNGPPASGVSVVAAATGHGSNEGQVVTTDSAGHYQITQLLPGKYCIEYVGGGGASGWTAIGHQVELAAGQSVEHIDIGLTHGAVISGIVRDKNTGLPLGDALVKSSGPDHPEQYNSENLAVTDSNGQYALTVSAGHQIVAALVAGSLASEVTEETDIADGDSKSLDFIIAIPGEPVRVTGTVIGVDGKPVSGAKVVAINTNYPYSALTDAAGQFHFDSPGLPPDTRLYAGLGTSFTADSQAIDADHDITLTLVDRGGISISGIVRDNHSKAVTGATIELFRANSDGSSFGIDSVKSDSEGKYIFPAEFAHGRYKLSAANPGYCDSNSVDVDIVGAKDITVATLNMEVADSFVGGTVVALNGAPIVGALVNVVGIRASWAQTDSLGRFLLKGVPEKKVHLRISCPLGRSADMQALSGRLNNVIVAMSRQEAGARRNAIKT
jgi:protocatechuate 3,4-dioxygenase beta subunit